MSNSSVPATAMIPESLRAYDQWVCWRTKQRDGKATKVPVDPATGSYASATDETTWGTFERAHNRATTLDDGSIGFVFTDADLFVGIDLDDCRDPDAGELDDWAVDVVDQLDSYVEVSPSGTGCHVLVEGSLPGDRNRTGDIELYDDARFFTVTGDHLDETPEEICAREESLAAVYEAFLAPDDDRDVSTEPPETDSSLADDEVITRAKAATNGEKFTRLWKDNTAGYESQSEADMALCCHLAFWTGGDEGQIDRLFRQSGLLREKWDEVHFADGSTYGEKTIERAVERTDEFYSPQSDRTARGQNVTPTEGTGVSEQSTASEPNSALEARLAASETSIEHLETRVATLSETCADLQAEPEVERQCRAELERELPDHQGSLLTRIRSLLPLR